MRVTEARRFDVLRANLQRTAQGMAGVSEHLSTGKRIVRLSDDPELAVQAERLTAQDRAIEAYTAAADNARGWLATQDTALQGGVNLMHRVRELALSAGVPQGTQARNGIAQEIENLRAQLVDVANTTYSGRSVFGGFAGSAVEDQGGTITFVGDDGAVQRRISQDRVISVNASGRDLFGFAAGDDVFAFLGELAAHVRAGDVATITSSDLDRLAEHTERMVEALGSVGASASQVDGIADAAALQRDTLRERVSTTMDTDLAETALELKLAETAYQSVLAATARLQLPNLVDYLR